MSESIVVKEHIDELLTSANTAGARAALELTPATTVEMEAGTETEIRSMSPANVAEAIAALAEGGSLDTDATIFATPDDDLVAKYAEAASLTPGGNALSRTNRATLSLMPGKYTISSPLSFNTNYVDVIGLGSADKEPSVEIVGDSLEVSAWDVSVVGIKTNNFNPTARSSITTGVTGTASTNTVNITGHGLVVGDVISFQSITGGSGLTTNVRYIVRTVGTANTFQLRVESTGANANFTTNITAGNVRIQSNTSQRITNCSGGSNSFGGSGGTASGTFTNCTGGGFAFGGDGTASGVFTGCVGGDYAFGGAGTASGVFTDCTGGGFTFGGDGGTASGTFTNCVGGTFAFGGGNTASGTFTGCTGGSNAFGGDGGSLTGKLYYCRLTSGAFETVTGGGITRYCIDGDNVANNQG
jgi:hypothetical protein